MRLRESLCNGLWQTPAWVKRFSPWEGTFLNGKLLRQPKTTYQAARPASLYELVRACQNQWANAGVMWNHLIAPCGWLWVREADKI